MGTLLKYLLYALIIVAIYFVAVGFYQGTLNKDSTLGEMTEHVTSNTKEVIKDGYETTKDAVQNGMNQISKETEETVEGGLKQ